MSYEPKHLARKYRVYPNSNQIRILAQDFGNARFVYNYILALSKKLRKEDDKKWSRNEYAKYLPGMKKDKEINFLSKSYSQVLQSAVTKLDTSFKNFFGGMSKFPKFRKRKNYARITYPEKVEIEYEAGVTKFPGKVGFMKTTFHREIPDCNKYISKSVVLSKDASGRYFASFNFAKIGSEDIENINLESSNLESSNLESINIDNINNIDCKTTISKGKKRSVKRKKGAKADEMKRNKLKVGDMFSLIASNKGKDLLSGFKKFSFEKKDMLKKQGILEEKKLLNNNLQSNLNNNSNNNSTSVSNKKSISNEKLLDQFISSLTQDDELMETFKAFTTGIDVGIKTLVVTADGQSIDNPRFLIKKQMRLKKLQKKQSKAIESARKKAGLSGKVIKKGDYIRISNNKRKLNLRTAKLHAKVSDSRKDYAFQTANELCKSWVEKGFTVVFKEDLNIKGMLRNHKLAKHLSDAALGQYFVILKHMASKYGITLVEIGRFDPSSKRCSECGEINKGLTLKDRLRTCNMCGCEHDRDENAAVNVNWYGIKNVLRYYLCKKLNIGVERGEEMESLECGIKGRGLIKLEDGVLLKSHKSGNNESSAKAKLKKINLISKKVLQGLQEPMLS